MSELEAETDKLQKENSKLQEEYTALDQKVVALTDEKKALEEKCLVSACGCCGPSTQCNKCLLPPEKAMDQEKSVAEIDRDDVQAELESNKKEQEDLLVLLADQDSKLKRYKSKLKELGQTVSV